MIKQIDILKGVHPGLFLEHELRRRKLRKVAFAKSINEHPQTIIAIMKGKRRMNTKLALKIEKLFNLKEGFLMVLQVFYDISLLKDKNQRSHPDLNRLRSVLFWDTNINTIDWEKQKSAVIKRVFERGNQEEKDEITRFYGKSTVNQILGKHANHPSL